VNTSRLTTGRDDGDVTPSEMGGSLSDDGQQLTDPRWEPWSPGEVARPLANVAVPWYVAGGRALDLHRGHVTRARDDLEIAVPAARFPAVRSSGIQVRMGPSACTPE